MPGMGRICTVGDSDPVSPWVFPIVRRDEAAPTIEGLPSDFAIAVRSSGPGTAKLMADVVIVMFWDAPGASVTLFCDKVATSPTGPAGARSYVSVTDPVFVTVIVNVSPGEPLGGDSIT